MGCRAGLCREQRPWRSGCDHFCLLGAAGAAHRAHPAAPRGVGAAALRRARERLCPADSVGAISWGGGCGPSGARASLTAPGDPGLLGPASSSVGRGWLPPGPTPRQGHHCPLQLGHPGKRLTLRGHSVRSGGTPAPSQPRDNGPCGHCLPCGGKGGFPGGRAGSISPQRRPRPAGKEAGPFLHFPSSVPPALWGCSGGEDLQRKSRVAGSGSLSWNAWTQLGLPLGVPMGTPHPPASRSSFAHLLI